MWTSPNILHHSENVIYPN